MNVPCLLPECPFLGTLAEAKWLIEAWQQEHNETVLTDLSRADAWRIRHQRLTLGFVPKYLSDQKKQQRLKTNRPSWYGRSRPFIVPGRLISTSLTDTGHFSGHSL